MTLTLILGGLCVGVGVVALALSYYLDALKRQTSGDKYRTMFLEAVDQLVDSKDVPDGVVHTLFYVARKLRSPKLLRSYLRYMVSGRRAQHRKLAKAVDAMIGEMPDAVRVQFIRAVCLLGIAMTYNNWLLGPIVRRIMWGMLNNTRVPCVDSTDGRVHAVFEAAQLKAA